MKKQEREQKKKEALKLYLEGYSKDEIARILGTSGSTIDKWDKQGNWKELYKQTSQKIAEKTANIVAKEKERSLKLIAGAEAILAKKMQEGTIGGASIPALAQLERVKWEILAPKRLELSGEVELKNLSILDLIRKKYGGENEK